MGVAHVGLVHCDPYGCKLEGFIAVSSIKRNVSKRGTCKGSDKGSAMQRLQSIDFPFLLLCFWVLKSN